MKITYSDTKFNAKQIIGTTVSKYNNHFEKFIACPTNFVMLDKTCPADIEAVNQVEGKWENAQFIKKIRLHANWMAQKKFDYVKIFALTTQTANFEMLDPSKILGFADISQRNDSKKGTLEFLQVAPYAKNVENDVEPQFKGCGTAILKSLKKIYNTIVLRTMPSQNLRNFYKNRNFFRILFTDNDYMWIANPIKLIIRQIFGNKYYKKAN